MPRIRQASARAQHRMDGRTSLRGTPEEWMKSIGDRVQVRADGCWIMDGTPTEYAVVTQNGKQVLAHRAVYQVFNPGQSIRSMHVHHRCQQPGCINPEHLEALSPTDHAELHWAERRLDS